MIIVSSTKELKLRKSRNSKSGITRINVQEKK